MLCTQGVCSAVLCSALHCSAELELGRCSAPLASTSMGCSALRECALQCSALLCTALHCSAKVKLEAALHLCCAPQLVTGLLCTLGVCSAVLCTALHCSAELELKDALHLCCAPKLLTGLLCTLGACSEVLCTALHCSAELGWQKLGVAQKLVHQHPPRVQAWLDSNLSAQVKCWKQRAE